MISRSLEPTSKSDMLKIMKASLDKGKVDAVRRAERAHRDRLKAEFEVCWTCGKEASQLKPGQRLRLCSGCLKVGRRLFYCSRSGLLDEENEKRETDSMCLVNARTATGRVGPQLLTSGFAEGSKNLRLNQRQKSTKDSPGQTQVSRDLQLCVIKLSS